MRIIYIDDFFHPNAGYHINLLSKYWSLFGHEVILFTAEADKTPKSLTSFFDYSNIETKDKAFEKRNNVIIERMPIYCVISGRAVYKKRIFQRIKHYKPDIVYCNGNDSLIGIQLIFKEKHANYGLVLDSHMLKMASVNRFRNLFYKFYRIMVTPIIKKRNIPVIRTQDDNFIEECLGIPLSTSPFISFGSDTLNFHPDKNVRSKFREEQNISEDAFVVVYAGKLNNAKGVDLLKEMLKEAFKCSREIIFVVVGSLDSSIENAENYFDECNNRIIRFPTQKYSDMPRFYQASDIAIFPKQCSLSFFDVQACGLPVVFEDNQLNRVRSANNNALVFAENNAEDFRNKIEYLAEMDWDEFDNMRNNSLQYIKNNFDYRDKAAEYIPILVSRLKKNSIKE